MVADMSYSTVSNVIDSWEEVRRLKDYEKIVGVTLFTKYVDSFGWNCLLPSL